MRIGYFEHMLRHGEEWRGDALRSFVWTHAELFLMAVYNIIVYMYVYTFFPSLYSFVHKIERKIITVLNERELYGVFRFTPGIRRAIINMAWGKPFRNFTVCGGIFYLHSII